MESISNKYTAKNVKETDSREDGLKLSTGNGTLSYFWVKLGKCLIPVD